MRIIHTCAASSLLAPGLTCPPRGRVGRPRGGSRCRRPVWTYIPMSGCRAVMAGRRNVLRPGGAIEGPKDPGHVSAAAIESIHGVLVAAVGGVRLTEEPRSDIAQARAGALEDPNPIAGVAADVVLGCVDVRGTGDHDAALPVAIDCV